MRFDRYAFDASHVTIAELLAQASGQTQVVDVETHRPDIDEVIAGMYERRPAQRAV